MEYLILFFIKKHQDRHQSQSKSKTYVQYLKYESMEQSDQFESLP